MAERGYADLTVRDLISGARVSRRTFYQLFDDKLDCVLAAHEMAYGRLKEAIDEACAAQSRWPEKIAAAVGAALRFAGNHPGKAQLIVVSCLTPSEPKFANHGHAVHEDLAAALRDGRKQLQGDHPLPVLTEQAVIGAAMSIVGARLHAGEVESLSQLRPELVQIILTPYLGEGEAQRVAISSESRR